MKISEILSRVDNLKPNDYEEPEKIRWLSELDMQIKKEVLDTYVGAEKIVFSGYEDASKEKELLVNAPFDEMYLYYLFAKIDWFNGEFSKYNANITMFNSIYENFQSWYIRNHKSIGVSKISYF